MPHTGDKCTTSGTYAGTCGAKPTPHHARAYFSVGDRFTPCATCGGSDKSGGAVMNWHLVSAGK